MNRQIKHIGLHLTFWGVYLLLEYSTYAVHYMPKHRWEVWRNLLTGLPVIMVGAYAVSYLFVPFFLKKRKHLLFALSIVAIAVLIFILRYQWFIWINEFGSTRVPSSKIWKNVVGDYFIIALAVCLKIIHDWYEKDRLNQTLLREKHEIELQLLKSQLHPHFLFNTLNNLYGLALAKSNKTADSILKLSELLDYLIYETKSTKVSLQKEVQLIQHYIALEELRYGKRLQLTVQVPDIEDGLKIAPLLLLPFVENAFKHCGFNQEGKVEILITLTITGQELYFFIKNSKKRHTETSTSGGIGLPNIQRRLSVLYPNKHTLVITEDENYFQGKLHLTLSPNKKTIFSNK